jgi:deoxyadenosine/deoxycytidine kinase
MAPRRKPFLVVAGNIGAGKTTMTARLSDELGLKPVFDNAQENPFLARFYSDPPASQQTWAFRSQLFFLQEGWHRHRQIQREGGGCVQELSVYENFLVMAHDHRDRGWINSEDFDLLSGLFFGMEELLEPPDLLVVLDAPLEQLIRRAVSQGRPGLTAEYLERLQQRYRAFADSWIHSPVLTIDTSLLDIATEEGLSEAAEIIISRLGVQR